MSKYLTFMQKKKSVVPVYTLSSNIFIPAQQRPHFQTFLAKGGSTHFGLKEVFIPYDCRFTFRQTGIWNFRATLKIVQ